MDKKEDERLVALQGCTRSVRHMGNLLDILASLSVCRSTCKRWANSTQKGSQESIFQIFGTMPRMGKIHCASKSQPFVSLEALVKTTRFMRRFRPTRLCSRLVGRLRVVPNVYHLNQTKKKSSPHALTELCSLNKSSLTLCEPESRVAKFTHAVRSLNHHVGIPRQPQPQTAHVVSPCLIHSLKPQFLLPCPLSISNFPNKPPTLQLTVCGTHAPLASLKGLTCLV